MSWGLGLLRSRPPKSNKPKLSVVTPGDEIGDLDGHRPAPAHWTDVTLDDVPHVPGMTQPDELRYFYWCCAARHRPGHRVVELGPYVGRSTMAMAAGLRRSAEPRAKVATLDRFFWNPWALENTLEYTVNGLSPAQRAQLTAAQLAPKENDSFLPLFQVYTEPLKDSIEVIDANLETYQWPGESIDVLMIDAAKCWDALDQIVRQFFPRLVDGAAVIHQDYKHFFTYWLHPVTERMLERGVLTLAENIEGTPTQGFRFQKKHDFRADDYLCAAFDAAESNRLMARSARRFRGRHDRLAVAGAHCRWLKDQQQPARARSVFAQAIRDGGFSDNYALADLLAVGKDWARSLMATLQETLTTVSSGPARDSKLPTTGTHTLVLPVPADGTSHVAEVRALDTTGAAELAMNLHADESSPEALRIRVQAAADDHAKPFYDEEFPLPPGGDVPAVVTLGGRQSIALRLTTESEGPATIARHIECIAPVLLLD